MSSSQRAQGRHGQPAALVAMLLVLLLATGLRFYQLGTDSLWGDEIYEARVAERDLRAFVAGGDLAVRPFLTHFFLNLSRSEFAIRFPYALFGILGVATAYRVGKALFDDETGLMAALLLAVSTFHIRYSQEARSYSLTVLLVLVSLCCLLRALESNQLRDWAGFAAATALSLNNNPTAGAAVASEVAFAVLVLAKERVAQLGTGWAARPDRGLSVRQIARGRRSTWGLFKAAMRSREGRLLLAGAVALLLFLGLSSYWFAYLSRVGTEVGSTGSGGASAVRLDWPFVEDLLRDFGAGRGLAIAIYGTAFATGVAVCVIRRQWRPLLLGALWLILPFAILPVISSSAYFGARHLIFLLPGCLLYVARGLVGLSQAAERTSERLRAPRCNWWGRAVTALGAGLFLWLAVTPVQAYYSMQKQEWNRVTDLIVSGAEAGDLVVQVGFWPGDAIPFYVGEHLSEAGIAYVHLFDIETVGEDQLPANVLWVVTQAAGKSNPRTGEELRALVGGDAEVYVLYQVTLVRPADPVSDLNAFSRVAARLIAAEAQLDDQRRQGNYLVRAYPNAIREELGKWLLEEERYEEAIDFYKRAIAMVPGHWGFHVRLAQAYQGTDQPDLAAAELERAISKAPSETWPRRVLADHFRSQGQLDRAIAAYQRVLELDPGDFVACQGMALAYDAQGEFAEAARLFQRVVELSPNHSLAKQAVRKLDEYRQAGYDIPTQSSP